MHYTNTVSATFLSRPNRFIAQVALHGQTETVHVKNTGRCRELLISGCEVILTRSDHLARKTQYDLVTVYKPALGWVNIDAQAPNQVVREWLEQHPVPFAEIDTIQPEYRFGASRVDFYLTSGKRNVLLEVKGCTLEIDGVGYFPDAPTERGVKHLRELAGAVEYGYEAYIAFVIAMPKIREVRPNLSTHPAFGEALTAAKKAGVHVLYLPCEVTANSLTIVDCIEA